MKLLAVGLLVLTLLGVPTSAAAQSTAASDPRQEGPLEVSGNLAVSLAPREPGSATFTVKVKNHGTDPTPPLRVYFEGVDPSGQPWSTYNSSVTPAVIQPGQVESFHASLTLNYKYGTWVLTGAFLWDADLGAAWKPLPANGQRQQQVFNVVNNFGKTVQVIKAGTGSGTVTSPDGQINCGEKCAGWYLNASPVTLNATPAPDSRFIGWSGPCTGTGPCYTWGGAVVVATFERITAGVQVGPEPSAPSGSGPSLASKLTARQNCGSISRVQFGVNGQAFNNAVVSVSSPGGPSNATTGFSYTPPPNSTTVTFAIRRATPSGGATVSPISLFDGCGEWRTFVGGGPDAFK